MQRFGFLLFSLWVLGIPGFAQAGSVWTFENVIEQGQGGADSLKHIGRMSKGDLDRYLPASLGGAKNGVEMYALTYYYENFSALLLIPDTDEIGDETPRTVKEIEDIERQRRRPQITALNFSIGFLF